MAKFKDAADREWDIDLDLTTADEILAAHEVDLIDTEKYDETYMKLNMNAKLVVDIAWTFVKLVANSKQISADDFKRAMKSANIREAKAAIVRAITDFSPSPEMAEAMQKIFRAAERKMEVMLGAITEEDLMASMSASSVGNTPG